MGNDMCTGQREGHTEDCGAHSRVKELEGDNAAESRVLWDVLDKRVDHCWVWRTGHLVREWTDTTGQRHVTMRLLDPRDLALYTGITIEVLKEDIQTFENMAHAKIYDARAWANYLGIDPKDILDPVGLQIDVLDIYKDSQGRKAKKWRKAEIIWINEHCTSITVHFHGWSHKYDETINLLRDLHERIRRFGSKSNPSPRLFSEETGVPSKDSVFSNQLKEIHMKVHVVEGDGNCLFRAVAHQIWGSQHRHAELRQMTLDYMEDRGIGRALVDNNDEKFRAYIAERRQDKVWGDDPEIRAMEEMLDLPIEVYNAELEDGGREPSTIHLSGSFPPSKTGDSCKAIRLSYHGYQHYNSVVLESNPPPILEGFIKCSTQDIYKWRRGED